MAVAAAGTFVYQQVRHTGPAHPAKWDSRVTPIVQFVETTRGLRFRHPVYIDLLDAAEYAARAGTVLAGDASLATRTKDHGDLLDAFGFATAYRPTADDANLSYDTDLGTYSPVTDRITLRGTSLTAGLRVVLAHELTHALQAQHFDIRLGRSDDFATRSIAEADAMRIGQSYLDTLPQADRDRVAAENTMDTAEAVQLSRTPWPMIEFRYAPFWLGPGLLQPTLARGGNAGVDQLFHNAPTEAELISRWRADARVVTPTVNPAAVPVDVPKGATLVQASTPLSLMQVLVMLDAWLPWSMARGALDHWTGGRYAAYRPSKGGTLCVAVTATFSAAPEAFATAISSWATAAGSTARPTVTATDVAFLACARGADAPSPPTPLIGPSTEILLENAAIPATVTDASTAEPYLCTVRAMIDNTAISSLLIKTPLAPAEQAVVDLARAVARQSCGS